MFQNFPTLVYYFRKTACPPFQWSLQGRGKIHTSLPTIKKEQTRKLTWQNPFEDEDLYAALVRAKQWEYMEEEEEEDKKEEEEEEESDDSKDEEEDEEDIASIPSHILEKYR